MTDLRALADRAAIQDVLLRYARGVDRRDPALVATCFTPDATYEGVLAHGTIVEALAALGPAMARYRSTLHVLANQLIELAGDTAHSETYCLAHHVLERDGRPVQRVVAVRYLDELSRHGERWLIHRRVVAREWERMEAMDHG